METIEKIYQEIILKEDEKMKALVVSSGSKVKNSILLNLINKSDYIICADGGIMHFMELGIKPDLIIGDLDSVDDSGLNYIKENNITIHKFPSEKNETDTELAIIFLMENKFKDITLVGVTGSRMDHTLSNIFLLKRLCKNNIKARIVDNNNTIYYVDEKMILENEADTFTSIIPITEEGVVVSLKGFYYPLENHLIEFGSSLGISNEIVEKFGTIIVSKGECIVVNSKD